MDSKEDSKESFDDIDEILSEIDTELKYDQKAQWVVGANCEIYSVSYNKWVPATIIKMFENDNGEQILVQLTDENNTTKEILIAKYSPNIRAINNPQNLIGHSLNDLNTLPILVTGGAGYIGSHTVIELIKYGFVNIIILDNFINSSIECIVRIKQITQDIQSSIVYYDIDIARDYSKLETIISEHKPYACIHFAALKAVGESVQKSLFYYRNNMVSTINLLELLAKYDCNNIIFSSSCTVYGNNPSNTVPLTEQSIVGTNLMSPYGKTKYFNEEILQDFALNNQDFNVVILRYFNPIGSHKSGLIGEDPNGIPNNLMPYILRVAIAQTKKNSHPQFYNEYSALTVLGNDYNTKDGTGVRDYVHVIDVANGHLNALLYDIMVGDKNSKKKNVSVYNLGTGRGTSVLELKNCMQKACGFRIPHVIKDRRPGDVDAVYADCSLAKQLLKWTPQFDINDMCKDAWNWQLKNPYGFKQN